MSIAAKDFDSLIEAFNQRNWLTVKALSAKMRAISAPSALVFYMTGIAHLELQELILAATFLRKACQLEPARADFQTQLARVLSVAHLRDESLQAADHASAIVGNDSLLLDTLGVVYAQNGQYQKAANSFKRAAEFTPSQASYRYNLATSLIALGDLARATREIEACLSLNSCYWRAHLTLAQLEKQSTTSNHIARLDSLLPSAATDNSAAICLNLALSKEYEDIGSYNKALIHLVEGKKAARKTINYSIEQDEATFSTLIETFPESNQNRPGISSDAPIFIIGMPRTGTTLVERIISSHSSVYSAGELLNFGTSLKILSGTPSENLIDPMTVTAARLLKPMTIGERYLNSVRSVISKKPHFTDKLPHNFLYAGFIAEAIPNATIICLRRNPMDTCLSNFRQLFAAKSPYFNYSFDLLDTGRYYILFDKLMRHWQKIFPGRILEINYEDLVMDQVNISHQILKHCSLNWEDDCFQFEKNQAPVATASAIQVREPIYRAAIDRWKRYGSQLDELRQLLASSGIGGL